jgi:hypothetical protein
MNSTKADAVDDSEIGERSGIYEVPPPTQDEITVVERRLDVARMQVRARCEPGLVQAVRDKGLSPDKEARKLVAYGQVLAMLARGDLRSDDLHAIKTDWSDAWSNTGAWARG